jgi:hypothetical protein
MQLLSTWLLREVVAAAQLALLAALVAVAAEVSCRAVLRYLHKHTRW